METPHIRYPDISFGLMADVPATLQCRKSCSHKIPDRRREKRVARIPGKSVVGGRRALIMRRKDYSPDTLAT